MGNKFPQTDLPQGIGGASDQWDTIQAGVILTDDFFVPRSPSVVLNTPTDLATGVSVTPALLFTGTDAQLNEIGYQVQVDTLSTFESVAGSSVVLDSHVEANRDALTAIDTVTRAGVGQSFTVPTNNYRLLSAQWFLLKVTSPTGNAVAKIYAHSGTFGASSVPTGTALATSNTLDVSTLTGSYQLITFTFSGANQITLQSGLKYIVSIESTDILTGSVSVGRDGSSPSHAGNWSDLQGGVWASASTVDNIFYVNGALLVPLLNKLSATPDPTFTGTGDPHPWPSGNQVTYTVQAGDTLTASTTYYWRVRGIDPLGSNSYGAFSSTQSFTTAAGGGGFTPTPQLHQMLMASGMV